MKTNAKYLLTLAATAAAFLPSSSSLSLPKTPKTITTSRLSPEGKPQPLSQQKIPFIRKEGEYDRISFLRSLVTTTTCVTLSSVLSSPTPANALVKGNAPPPKKKKGEGKKCTNVEECQEMAENLASAEANEARANYIEPSVAPKGTRYSDVVLVDDPKLSPAKSGDMVEIRYKVLKLGKRSFDGISGEGTVVFSRGYGLEDDEKAAGQTSFKVKTTDPSLISALSDTIPGMYPGSVRRISISPRMGWERDIALCDGGPGGSGAGGELKTDYVIVPTATMVSTETCFDKSRKPFPTTYGEERRMAQRFDQSLIMELELVNIL